MAPSSSLTPAERSLRARVNAHKSWAATEVPSARTAPARKALQERFLREVDPNNELPTEERERRAGHARKAFYAALALRSARSRRRAAELTAEAEAAESELSEADDAA